MRCPFCGLDQTQVKDSRSTDDNAAIRRRRYCPDCSGRFTTVERIQLHRLMVQKKDGELEEFDREKLAQSLYLALHKRDVEKEHIERVINSLVRQLESMGESEMPATTIGEHVMEALKDLDCVGYIRYASIYRKFTKASDFEKAAIEFENKGSSTKTTRPKTQKLL